MEQQDVKRLVSSSTWDYFYMELIRSQQDFHKRQLQLTNGTSENQQLEGDIEGLLQQRMDPLGYRVGYSLAEQATLERTRFVDVLDIIKFLCKDIWMLLFKKQIDNLKTNHRGVYVLTDSSFKWISRMSSDSMTPDAIKRLVSDYMGFPCGLIRGILANLGVNCQVSSEVSSPPQATFNIKLTVPSK